MPRNTPPPACARLAFRLTIGLAQDIAANRSPDPVPLAPEVLHPLAVHVLRHSPLTGDRVLARSERMAAGGETAHGRMLERLLRVGLPPLPGVCPSILTRLFGDPINLSALGRMMKAIEAGGPRPAAPSATIWH